MGAVALILAEGFPRQLIDIFGAANESSYYTDFAIKAFRTYLCMMILGLDGVLYSMPVSDILTFIISAIIIAKTYRELNEKGV